MWSNPSSLKLLLSDSKAGAGSYRVTIASVKGGLVLASASSQKSGDDAYAYITIGGSLCARDRGSETSPYPTHSYQASAACSIMVAPGTYNIVVYGTASSHITVLEL